VFVELEEGLVVGVAAGPVVKPPAFADVSEQAVLVRFIAPEAPDPALRLVSSPSLRIQVPVWLKGSRKRVAMAVTALGKPAMRANSI
jgi:hypothetical protein